jgi:hypothetical protein
MTPGFGEEYLTAHSIKQTSVEFALQGRDTLANGGLREIEMLCGLGERAVVGYLNKSPKRI